MAGRRRARWPLYLALPVLLLLALEIVVRLTGLVQVGLGVATPQQAAFNEADMLARDDRHGLSYANKPGAETRVEAVVYRHDERGRRIMPATSAPDAPAVAFLGDSTTYGLGLVPEHTLPAQVATALDGGIRPLNLGVCGYGTAQEAALYAAEREQLDGAELIVLVVFPNDFAPGSFQWDRDLHALYFDPLPIPRGVRRTLWNSALYRGLVTMATDSLRSAGALDPTNPDNVPQALSALGKLARLVREDGRRLLVAHLPAMEALDPYQFAEPIEMLAEHCAEIGVPYVDLLDAFLAERERQITEFETRTGETVTAQQRAGFLSQYWIVDPKDHHLNAEANRIAAGALGEAIAELLPR